MAYSIISGTLKVMGSGIRECGIITAVHARLLKRVRDEAEVLKVLKHPNILRVLGVARAAPVLTYEFGDGGSAE